MAAQSQARFPSSPASALLTPSLVASLLSDASLSRPGPSPSASLSAQHLFTSMGMGTQDVLTLLRRLRLTFAPACAAWNASSENHELVPPWDDHESSGSEGGNNNNNNNNNAASDPLTSLYAYDAASLFVTAILAATSTAAMLPESAITAELVQLLDDAVPIPVKQGNVPCDGADFQRLAANAHLEVRDWVARAHVRNLGENLANMPPEGYASVRAFIETYLPEPPAGIPKQIASDWEKRRSFLLDNACQDHFMAILTDERGDETGQPHGDAVRALRNLATHMRNVMRRCGGDELFVAAADKAGVVAEASAAIGCLLEADFPFQGALQLSVPGPKINPKANAAWKAAKASFLSPPPQVPYASEAGGLFDDVPETPVTLAATVWAPAAAFEAEAQQQVAKAMSPDRPKAPSAAAFEAEAQQKAPLRVRTTPVKDPPFPTRTRRRGVIPEQFPADGADGAGGGPQVSNTRSRLRGDVERQPQAEAAAAAEAPSPSPYAGAAEAPSPPPSPTLSALFRQSEALQKSEIEDEESKGERVREALKRPRKIAPESATAKFMRMLAAKKNAKKKKARIA